GRRHAAEAEGRAGRCRAPAPGEDRDAVAAGRRGVEARVEHQVGGALVGGERQGGPQGARHGAVAPDGEGGGRGGAGRGRLDAGRGGGRTAGRRGSRLVLRGGRQPLSGRVVAVEAAPGLAPQAPGGDQRALQRVRPEAGLLVERAVDALAGGEVHV